MPPLAGPSVMLYMHPIAGEDLDLAVVHLHRARHGDLPLGMGEDLPDAGIEVEDAGRPIELLEHRAKDAAVSAMCVLIVGRGSVGTQGPRVNQDETAGRMATRT